MVRKTKRISVVTSLILLLTFSTGAMVHGAIYDIDGTEKVDEGTEDSGDTEDTEDTEDTDEDTEDTVVVEEEENYVCFANSINNESDVADFKLSSDDFNVLWKFSGIDLGNAKDVTYDHELKKGNRYYTEADTPSDESQQEYFQARSWLIENDSLERPFSLGLTSSGIKVIRQDDSYDWIKGANKADKSDLVTMLYRGLYGSEAGRPLIYGSVNVGDKKVQYDVYTTGNVYENYLKEAIEKGLILKSDLTEDALTSINLTGTATWNASEGWAGAVPDLEYGNPGLSMNTKDNQGCWGASYVYSTEDDGSIKIESKQPNYFVEEDMTLIDALGIVETFLKNTEKNVTATEADIVAYKYGVEYLSELTEDEYNTVEFLIAKGVLNFEDYDSIGFFETVRWKDLLPIIYRAVNKDARYDFSIIQLTDGEAFWQEKGFSKGSFTLTIPNEGTNYVLDTVSVTENAVNVSSNKQNGIDYAVKYAVQKLHALVGVSASSKTKSYTVVKDFDTVNSYKYDGVEVSKLFDSMSSGLVESNPEIVSIKKEQVNNTDVYRMTLTIVATNSTRAVQMVDDRISATVKDASAYKITGVMKIKDGKEIRMISKSILEQCFGDKIDFIEDKVLVNAGTGAMACLLPSTKYALVGNQVFVNENLLVVSTDGEAYYNFDVISSLLGMSVIKFYSGSVNTQKIASDATVYDANLFGSSGSLIGKTEYLVADVQTSNNGEIDSFELGKDISTVSNPEYYYNVNQIANGMNTIYRIYYKKFKPTDKKKPYVVVVDWVYAVPDLDDFNSSAILPSESVSGTATWNDVFTNLYTAPADGTALRAWWDSNLAMSQGLTTMLFNQSGTQFIKCGYMVPKVSVLLPEDVKDEYSGSNSLEKVSDLLIESGFKVPSAYKKYFSNSTSNFLTKYYKNFTGLTKSSQDFTTVKEFAARTRECSIQFSSKYKTDNNVRFGDEFYLEGWQVLYRNLVNDSRRLEYNADGDKKLSYMKTKDRVAPDSESPLTGSVVTHKENGVVKEYMYVGITNRTVNDETRQYIALVPIYDDVFDKAVEFKLKKSDNNYTVEYVKSNSSSSWKKDVLNRFYSNFNITSAVADNDPWLKTELNSEYGTSIFKLWDCASDALSAQSRNEKIGLFYQGGLSIYRAKNGSYESLNSRSATVKAVPTVYLPAGDYYVYKSAGGDTWEIGTGRTAYLLNQSTIYYSGIIDGIIDSILAQNAKATNIGNLEDGTILYVDDTRWVKNDGVWCSYPISNSTAASIAVRGASNAKKAFDSIFSAFPIECDGIDVPLANYVKTCTLGTKYAKKTPVGEYCVILGSDNDVQIIKRTKKSTKKVSASTTARYVIFAVKFNDSLLVRPISSDGNVYRVCNTASERVLSGQQIPFFTEDLNFDDTKKTSFNLSQSGFENTATFELEKEDFNSDFKQEWQTDFKTLVAMIIIVAASYLMIISWAVYLGITKGTVVVLFEALARPSRITGKNAWVDFVKILSLSIYSLDSPPQLGRCTVTTVVCLFLITVCANFI